MPRVTIRPGSPDRKTLDIEIARLRGLDVGELRAKWHTVFRRRAPPHAAPEARSHEFLIKSPVLLIERQASKTGLYFLQTESPSATLAQAGKRIFRCRRQNTRSKRVSCLGLMETGTQSADPRNTRTIERVCQRPENFWFRKTGWWAQQGSNL
jgi:hypothetical protein